TFLAHPQGLVYFANDDTLSTPPDRLVKFASADTPGNVFGTNLAPAVGTNYLVQLYYGASTASEASLTPVSEAPAHLRESTTIRPGIWFPREERVLNGFTSGFALLQVRIWDVANGGTFEEALANNPGGVFGRSLPFIYQLPSPSAPLPTDFLMLNF